MLSELVLENVLVDRTSVLSVADVCCDSVDEYELVKVLPESEVVLSWSVLVSELVEDPVLSPFVLVGALLV